MDREVLENIVLNGISGVDGICDMIKDCIDSGDLQGAKDWIDQTKNWFFDLGPANQAFILLLSSDVLVGYHSADGWNTVLESLGEKYGISDNHAAISIFTALVPVGMDVLFKFWVFKYLRKLAPSTQIILDDIDRH